MASIDRARNPNRRQTRSDEGASSSLREGTPGNLEELILRPLEKDPARRPASAEVFFAVFADDIYRRLFYGADLFVSFSSLFP